MGTLRRGFLTTPAETDALSTPMKAHRVKFRVALMARTSLSPVTFQPDRNVSLLNQNHPSRAMPRMGISARRVVMDCTRPTSFGPSILA